MIAAPTLRNDFIVNEREYQACKAWLDEVNEHIVRHPLENPGLEVQRRSIKAMIAEYEENWRHNGRG